MIQHGIQVLKMKARTRSRAGCLIKKFYVTALIKFVYGLNKFPLLLTKVA